MLQKLGRLQTTSSECIILLTRNQNHFTVVAFELFRVFRINFIAPNKCTFLQRLMLRFKTIFHSHTDARTPFWYFIAFYPNLSEFAVLRIPKTKTKYRMNRFTKNCARRWLTFASCTIRWYNS